MIERYVFLKLNDEQATPEGRAAVVEATRALEELPGVRGITIGTPGDAMCSEQWDLSIVVRFARIEDVEPYRLHPSHRAYVDEFLKPRMAAIKAWNFEIG